MQNLFLQQITISMNLDLRILLAIVTLIIIAIILIFGRLLYLRSMRLKRRLHMSAIFTNITHEFRTPLTLIAGLTERLITNPQLPRKDVDRCLASISHNGDDLLELVNELLDVSKMIIGEDKEHWMHGNLAAYVGMAVSEHRADADGRQSPLVPEVSVREEERLRACL